MARRQAEFRDVEDRLRELSDSALDAILHYLGILCLFWRRGGMGLEIDPDTLELLERRLGDKVEVQVREKLFKFYRAIWAVALVVFGFFGYNVISGLTESARTYAEGAVGPSVTAANSAANEARTKLQEISTRLEALDDFQKRREDALVANEARVLANQAKVDGMAATTDLRLQSIVDKLGEAEAQLAAVGQRTTEVAGLGNLADLASNLASLTEQVQSISNSIRVLEERIQGEGPEVITAAQQSQISTLLDNVRQAAVVAPPPLNTVYFQFAGVTREAAQDISNALDATGYHMPGLERTASAAKLSEVRYFFANDRDRAEGLAADVNRILIAAGYRGDVTVRDLTNYRSTKPREGTLELWLEPIPAR